MTRRTVLAGFAALAGIWLLAASLGGRRPPAHAATAAVPALGLSLTAEVFTLSDLTEFERRLTLAEAGGGGELKVRMADVRGPAHRTSLYRVGEAELAVLGPAGDDYFFAAGPLRRLDGPSRPSEEWTYLGAFDLRMTPAGGPAGGSAQVFAFVPADAGEECIPTLLEGARGGPHRRQRVQRTCPPPAVPDDRPPPGS